MSRHEPAPPVTLTCQHCGVSFTRKHWEVKPGKPTFCGRDCTNASRIGIAPVCSMPPVRQECVCQTCGKSFAVPLSYIRKGAGKNCSPACANISRRRSEKRACTVCGVTFTVKPSVVASGGGLFCSTPCSNKSRTGIRPATKTNQPHKFGQTEKLAERPVRQPLPGIKPKADKADQLVWSGSNIVNCAGCGRTRERGQHCVCERVEGIAS